MNDTKIILNVVSLSIPDNHPQLYLYVTYDSKRDRRGKDKIVNEIVKYFDGILMPPYSVGHVRTVVKRFLKDKLREYKEGKIKITPIY